MIKLRLENRGIYTEPGTLVYEVVGIKEKKLCLKLLELKLDSGKKRECWYRQNLNLKIYYDLNIGNYIVNPSTHEKIVVDDVIKKLFDEFYIKGE